MKHLILFAALTGIAAAGPGNPGFAASPEWLDANNNGQIDPEEFQAWAEARAAAAKGLADRADANGDGAVDPEERANAIADLEARILAKRCELFEAVAGEAEEGEDGPTLTRDEFLAIGPVANLPEQIVDLLFGLLDANGDHKVTKEEFLAAIGGDLSVPDLPGGPDLPDIPRP